MRRLFAFYLLIAAWAVPPIQSQDVKPAMIGSPLNNPTKHANKADSTNKEAGKADKKEHPPVFNPCVDSSWKGSNEQEEQRIKREVADLEQQTIMADASKKSASYTLWGIAVSGFAVLISLGVGIFSIMFSGRTLRQAETLQRETLDRMDRAEANAERFHIETRDQTADINTLTLNRMDQAAAEQRTFNLATLDEMKRTEKRASEHSELEMRAYIKLHVIVHNNDVLNKMFVESPAVYLSDYAYAVKIENVGKSPAKNLTGVVQIRYDSLENPDESAFIINSKEIENHRRQTDVSPGGTRGLYRRIQPSERPDDRILLGIRSREMGVFIFGRFFFQDAFGKDRIVNFRFIHRILQEETKFNDVIHFYKTGNEAT